jgi:hypothetical protein
VKSDIILPEKIEELPYVLSTIIIVIAGRSDFPA